MEWAGSRDVYLRQYDQIDHLDVDIGSYDTLVAAEPDITDMSASPISGELMYVVDAGSSSTVFAVAPGEVVREFAARDEIIYAVAWSPDGRSVSMLFEDRVDLVDVNNGSVVRSIPLAQPLVSENYR